MWILAVSSKCDDRGNLEDFWSVHDTEEEARQALAPYLEDEKAYCWAIAPITEGSEPHYAEDHEEYQSSTEERL